MVPAKWRRRFGAELLDLISDAYGELRPPFRAHLSIIRAGLVERVRAVGFVDDGATLRDVVRGGSLLVLSAWAFFVAGGALLAKFSEHWQETVSTQHRVVLSSSFAVVQYAALGGALIVLVAAGIVLPTMARFISLNGWKAVRVCVVQAFAALVVATGTTAAVIAGSHHGVVPSFGRSAWRLRAVGITWGLVSMAALAVGTSALMAAVARLELSRRVSHIVGVLALSMVAVLSVIFLASLAWWINYGPVRTAVLRDRGHGYP